MWSPVSPIVTKIYMEYIEERTFEERYKEHLKAPSPINGHQSTTGHQTTMENFSILGRKGHGFARMIKESIYTRVNNPTLNKNIGKYNLPHIWDGVTVNTSELQIKQQLELSTHQQEHRTEQTPPRTSRSYVSADINNIHQTQRS